MNKKTKDLLLENIFIIFCIIMSNIIIISLTIIQSLKTYGNINYQAITMAVILVLFIDLFIYSLSMQKRYFIVSKYLYEKQKHELIKR